MRFNNVEVERAYWDYLDFLEDWPPPEDVNTPTTAAIRAAELDRNTPLRTALAESSH